MDKIVECDEEQAVGREIRILSNLLAREFHSEMSAQGVDRLTAVNSWILAYLSYNSDKTIYQRDIEREFLIARSTVTQLVKLMEKKGLIERSDDKSDGRLKSLKLTEKGEQLHTVAHEGMLHLERRLCSSLSRKEIEAFISTAEKMKQNLKCENGKGGCND